jgi:hypothetical protein
MVLRRFAGGWLLLASLAVLQPAIADDGLRVIDTGPVNNGTEKGRSEDFFVRFNRPVDHIHSDFVIMRGGQVVQVLQPRFETSPDVLFARRSALPPGDYTLVWQVRTLEGEPVAIGEIAFRIDKS